MNRALVVILAAVLLDAIGAPSTAPEAAEAAPEASDVVPRLVVRDSSAPAPSPGR